MARCTRRARETGVGFALIMLLVGAWDRESSAQAPPLYELVEDLRISSRTTSPQLSLTLPIHGPITLRDGSIVTGHNVESLVRVFSPTGTLVATFNGATGAARPFQNIWRISTIGDSILVNEMVSSEATFRLYSRTGQHIRDVPESSDAGPTRVGLPRVSPATSCLLTDQRRLMRVVYRSPSPTGRGSLSDSSIFFLEDARNARTTRIVRNDSPTQPTSISYQPNAGRSTGPGSAITSAGALAQPLTSGSLDACAPGSSTFVIATDALIFGGQPGQVRLTEVGSSNTVRHTTVSLPPIRVPATFADSFAKARAISYQQRPASPRGPARPPVTDAQAAEFERTVRSQLFVPEFYPVVRNVLLGRDGSLWLDYPYAGGTWVMLIDKQLARRVVVPAGVRLTEVSRDFAWAVTMENGEVVILRYRLVRKA